MDTITLQDQHGVAAKFDKAALFKTLEEAGVHVQDENDVRIGKAGGVPFVARTEVKEAPLFTKSDERAAARKARLDALIEYDMVSQAKRIMWKMIEVAGIGIVVGGLIIAGIWVMNTIWRGPEDGPMPNLA